MALTQAEIAGQGVLGIQGDAGVGKTTIGFAMAPYLGATVYETSNGFRGFTAYILYRGIDVSSETSVSRAAQMSFETFEVANGRVLFDGVDVTNELRSPVTTHNVANIASYRVVRQCYIDAMLRWVTERPAIVIGRHIREVWPNSAVLQIERHDDDIALRRAVTEGEAARANLAARSEQDRLNAVIAMVDRADEYTLLDTTGMSEDEQRNYAIIQAFSLGFRIAPNIPIAQRLHV